MQTTGRVALLRRPESFQTFGIGLATLAILGLAAVPAAQAQVTGSSSGVFSSYTPEGNPATAVVSGIGTNTITFGGGSTPNKFVFNGNTFNTSFGTSFNVGTFTYTNGTVPTGTSISSADLKATLVFTAPNSLGSQTFTYDIPLTNTPNNGTAAQNADYITLPGGQPSESFTFGGTTYTLQISGFNVTGLNPNAGFLTGAGGAAGNTELHVYEGSTASAGITAMLTQSTAVPEPSSVAAFAFTGLGAAGLILKARKRKTQDA